MIRIALAICKIVEEKAPRETDPDNFDMLRELRDCNKYVIDPKEFPRIEEMPVYWWYAQINRGTMGKGRAINKAAAGSASTSTPTSNSASSPGSNSASKPGSPKSPGSADPGRKARRRGKSVSLSDLDENELNETIGLPFRDFDVEPNAD